MNRSGFFAIVLMGSMLLSCNPQPKQTEISLIPKPVEMEEVSGGFKIRSGTPILYSDQSLAEIAGIASKIWTDYLGFELRPTFTEGSLEGGSIMFFLNADIDEELGEEGYLLEINPNGIKINANKPAGILYGVQTLYQVLSTMPDGKLPGLNIKDYPRFRHRGMHLDVARHFHPIEFIYKVIDQLAMHKLNVFHWHLTDDQGWRLEIKQYPKLTEVGAWRVDMSHLHWDARPVVNDPENSTYGGFYTQEEVRALVAYAAERNVAVIPEIEMPAHAMAALAAYPEFSCTGENVGVATGGVWPITHIFCAGNDGTFEFLENVLTEVMDLFPSSYIHIGGDEADKSNWKVCPKCQARIREEGLANEEELQSYFIHRVEEFLNAHGRRIIGWDEILEGGLAPNATVMSWRGEAGGIEAAKMGHDVIMSPGSPLYFDHYQGDPDIEPTAFGGNNTLKKVYTYEPIPVELNEEEAKHILGAQANHWGEFMPVSSHVEYMAFPRLSALAEVVWSQKEYRDWGDFSRRMQAQYARYEKQGLNYSMSAFQVKAVPEVNLEHKSLMIGLESEVFEPEIRYTLDGSEPDANSTVYKEPFEIKETTTVQAAVFIDGKSSAQIMKRDYLLHKAFAGTISAEYPNSPNYDGQGEYTLVNGITGTRSYVDGNWKGYRGVDLVATLDLGAPTSVHLISVDALHTSGSWIFLPQWVSFEVSTDGEVFELLERVENETDINLAERFVEVYSTQKPADNVRFVRVTVKNQGVCPPGHSGEGQPSWLFVSEIIVE
ncbi:MAG: family 20 glycosylhydrolase [Bacteroidales bacterium]|jgi:hexosaminidase|nr:family 20 glycosylhydrolase [Bacteroidales bacterium]